jgi:alpha-D-xyloside xylohydrolase
MIERYRLRKIVGLSLLFGACCFASPVGTGVEHRPDGVSIPVASHRDGIRSLTLRVWSPTIIQVIANPSDTLPSRRLIALAASAPTHCPWGVKETAREIIFTTDSLVVRVDRTTYRLTFSNVRGVPILSENGRMYDTAHVMGESCFHIKQSFCYGAGEMLYGLGSYQHGDLALNGKKLLLLQKNRDDVVPMLVSTAPYGILWNNASLGEFNDVRGSYYIWSEVADAIDYFFVGGSSFDAIIAGYRQLTGTAPLFPRWAYGYLQSKQRYQTQDEIVAVVKGFRDRKFPLDCIIQDWMYWPEGQWGQKSFDRTRYPDPARMMRDIHAMNTSVLISIWPNMAKGSPNQMELLRMGGLLTDSSHLDVMNADARATYWRQTRDSLYSYGIDGWWIDCSEGYDSDWTSPYHQLPQVQADDLNVNTLKQLMGSGRYLNAYALQEVKGIYEGQRGTTAKERTFILTRSSFAGMQRYAAAYWTGDVSANWDDFRRQIPAGLNFCMSGVPYWTTDIAGYFIKQEPGWWFSRGAFELGQKDEGFNELYARWFQFAALCPLFRAHGADFPREPWAFGDSSSRTYRTLLKFTNLRYRLLPYLYSLAANVTQEQGTIMRALPFDFLSDRTTWSINNQFLFGPSIMVCPVDQPLYHLPNNVALKTKDFVRQVYLPNGTQWWDFWTGRRYEGGKWVTADAAFETMPLYVRAGSIVPMGPEVQYSTEQRDPLEIRIYPGADASFSLYEDDNISYGYEKKEYSRIAFSWSDAKRELTIGGRTGSFPGMPPVRTFSVVVVSEDVGAGIKVTTSPAKRFTYEGRRLTVKL